MPHRLGFVVLVVLLVTLGAATPVTQTPPEVRPAAARVTDPARPDFDFLPWAGSELTVVVVLSADCKPCVDTVPFLNRLVRLPAIDRKARRVAFLAKDGIWPAIDMIEKHPDGFKVGQAMSYPDDDRFGVTTLPAVLVFDGRWKRRGTWTGAPSPAQQAEILALVKQIAAEARKENRR